MQEKEMIVGVVAMSLVFGLPMLVCIVWLVAHHCLAAFRSWQEIGLKREMVARGYTVQEIAAVVGARGKTQSVDRAGSQAERGNQAFPDVPPAKPIKQPAYSP